MRGGLWMARSNLDEGGCTDDHNRLDRMSLLTNVPYLASLGRGWSQRKYCVSSTRNMTLIDRTS